MWQEIRTAIIRRRIRLLNTAWHVARIRTGMSSSDKDPPRLMHRVRQEIRLRHYSRRTEEAYSGWIRRFIMANGKRHPQELGEREVTLFLSNLAARGVSASTQNQALSAILFL